MSLKAIVAGIQNNLTTSYDQTKTTIAGSVAQRLVNSIPVLSPPPVKWLDVLTDAAETPFSIDYTTNGRVFAITSIVGGLARLVLYTLDPISGVTSYVGKIQLSFANVPATNHVIHGLRIDDTNPSAIKVFIATTASTLVNGGLYMANNLALADFVPIGFATLAFAQGSNQKAMYLLEDPSNFDAGQLNIASAAIILDRVNQVAYVHNGVALTHQYYLYDYSQTPNVPVSNCTTPVASPGVTNLTAHGYNANDHVVFGTSGALPTGLVAGNVYFVLATGLTANSFQVSLTAGGAAINFTGSTSGTSTVARGFGITGSLWKWKTANLPALTGTLLLTNSEKYVTPGHTANSGTHCAFFATSSNLYLGQLSDLTSGQTLWPSLVTSNVLGAANQVTIPFPVNAGWDDTLDRAVFTTSTTKIIAKQLVNNVIQNIFGVLNNDFLEGQSQTDLYTQFGAITVSDFRCANGWYVMCCTTTGQRGIIAMNAGADQMAGNSYAISPVINLFTASQLIGVVASLQQQVVSADLSFYYRTSGFGSATGGWTQVPVNGLFPALTTATKIQLKILYGVTTLLATNPPFPIELFLTYQPISSISDYWEGSVDNSTQNGTSPMYVAFRHQNAYGGTVPKLYVRGIDDSGNTIYTFDTVTNASLFSYSTNNGTSWNALGTIPDTALTTELRVNIASPSGTRLTWAISES